MTHTPGGHKLGAAYLAQARADWQAFKRLCADPEWRDCHAGLLVQMAIEKASKARLYVDQLPRSPQHVVVEDWLDEGDVQELLTALVSWADTDGDLGIEGSRDAVLRLALALEGVNPSAARLRAKKHGKRPDEAKNIEYPWRMNCGWGVPDQEAWPDVARMRHPELHRDVHLLWELMERETSRGAQSTAPTSTTG